jgi:serine/threonine protein kinase
MPEKSRAGEILVGKYELLSKLGSGGMGDVYVARHRLLDRRVAIKLLHPEHARDSAMIHRLLREARAASEVHHPHIVEVLDVDREPGKAPFIVQELLDGRDLGNFLRELGTGMPSELALRLLLPVVDAIAAAHMKGIVHRDIKPENVFLAKKDGAIVPKVLDFGLAKSARDGARLTATDVVMGTPAYMSPEQITKPDSLGPASDVWSLGVLFYETLSGRLPFEADGIHALLLAITSLAPRPLSHVAKDVPRDLEKIVMKALRHDPRQRPHDAGELLALLSELDEDLRGPLRHSEPGEEPPSATAQTMPAIATSPREGAETRSERQGPSASEKIRKADLGPVPPHAQRRDPTPARPRRPTPPQPQRALELAYVPRPRSPSSEGAALEVPESRAPSDWIDVLLAAGLVAASMIGLAATGGRLASSLGSFWPLGAVAGALAIASVFTWRRIDHRGGTKIGAAAIAIGLFGTALFVLANGLAGQWVFALRVRDTASEIAPWIAALAPAGLAILAAQRARNETARGATGTAVVYIVLCLVGVALALAIGRMGFLVYAFL